MKNEKGKRKMKNNKNIEIAEVKNFPGTNIKMLVMRDGTRYFRQRSIARFGGNYPGEADNAVSIMSGSFFWRKPDEKLKYARVWYDRAAYVHEQDIRDYIIERQGLLENKIVLHAQGQNSLHWTVEAAKMIKLLFGMKVSTNGRHEQPTAPKEIAEKFANSPHLRYLYQANRAMIKGYLAQRKFASYWPELVQAEEDLFAWKANKELENGCK